MNNKTVARTALAVAIVIFGVVLFITFKDKIFKGDSAKVKIVCNASVTTGELKKNDSFKCNIMSHEYTLTVKSVDKDKIVIKADQYGLYDESDSGISLTDKKDTFEITKGKTLKLRGQATDLTDKLDITWE